MLLLCHSRCCARLIALLTGITWHDILCCLRDVVPPLVHGLNADVTCAMEELTREGEISGKQSKDRAEREGRDLLAL